MSHLFSVLIFLFNILLIGLMMGCSSRNMQQVLRRIVSCVCLIGKRNRPVSVTDSTRGISHLKITAHHLALSSAIYALHAIPPGCFKVHFIWACLMGIQPADFTGWRLKQCGILFAAARFWLARAIIFSGSCLLNQNIQKHLP